MDVAHQPPLSIQFSKQEYWSGLPFPSPGDLSDPDIEPRYPTMQADCLPSEVGTCQSWTPTIPQKLGGKGTVFFDVYIPEMGPALEKHLKVVPLVPILQMRTQRLSYLPE